MSILGSSHLKSCHVMLPCHVGKGGLWPSHLAISEIRNLQARFHPHAVRSSLARTDSHGFLAPCWCPLIQGFPHTPRRLGTILRTRKVVLNVACCFPLCCVVTWNMVLKCLWRCVACSNIKPREVSRRSAQVPRKRPITANHCIRVSGCSASNQRPTNKACNGMVLFPSVLGRDMERSAQMSVYMGRGCHQWRVAFCLLQQKPKEVSRRSVQFPLKKADQKANHCITISGCSASNQRLTKKAGNGMVLFLSALGCALLGEHESWMARWNLGMKNLYTGEFWTCNLAMSERLCFCWRILIRNVWMLVRNLLLATWCLGNVESNPVFVVDAPPSFPGTFLEIRVHERHTWIYPKGRGWNEMKWNHLMLCYHVMSARVVYGLATWPYPKSEICRHVFTPMLSGLRWPGQTVMGSWPPADALWFRAFHTHTHLQIHTQTSSHAHMRIDIYIYIYQRYPRDP